MLSITDEMEKALEVERKKRMLSSIPETARVIIGEYLANPTSHELNEVLKRAVKEYAATKNRKR